MRLQGNTYILNLNYVETLWEFFYNTCFYGILNQVDFGLKVGKIRDPCKIQPLITKTQQRIPLTYLMCRVTKNCC